MLVRFSKMKLARTVILVLAVNIARKVAFLWKLKYNYIAIEVPGPQALIYGIPVSLKALSLSTGS